MPAVPTGGSAAKAPANPAAGAADPATIIAAVQADLDQLQAMDQLAKARHDAALAQKKAATAAAMLAASQTNQTAADQSVAAARNDVHTVAGRLSSIAVAAYTGAAYSSPAAAPTHDPGEVPGALGIGGTLRSDANEMISLITAQENKNLRTARKTVARAKDIVDRAASDVARARAVATAAGHDLSAARTNLAQTMRGATVAGAAAAVKLSAPPAATTPPNATPAPAPTAAKAGRGGPTILGPPTVTAAEIAGWFSSSKHPINTTVPVTQLAVDYLAAGQATGVRGDLAFAQSIIETGYFSFPAGGQLVTTDNNFAGIGACDSCMHGWPFPNAITGITAQQELLEAYASSTQVPTPLVGPVGVGGCCPTWTALAGTWATDPSYGISILTVYKAMLDFAIPEQLVAAGLAPPGSAPPLPAVPPAPAAPTLPATPAAPRPPTLAPISP